MPLALSFAVFTALAFGASDFFGGIGAGRLGVARGTLITFAVAAVVAVIALPFAGGVFSADAVRWGLLAGVFEIAGLLAFYAALVAGALTVLVLLTTGATFLMQLGARWADPRRRGSDAA